MRRRKPTPMHHRRAQIRKMIEDGILPSQRSLAAKFNVGVATINSDVQAVRGEQNRSEAHPGLFDVDGNPVAGAENGNTRSVSHGARSERLIAPRADEIAEIVFAANTHLHPERDQASVLRYAQTLTRIERVYSWLDDQADPVFTGRGAAHPAYGRLDRWETTAERSEVALGISPMARAKLGLPVDANAQGQDHDLALLADSELEMLEWLTLKMTGHAVGPPPTTEGFRPTDEGVALPVPARPQIEQRKVLDV